MTQPVTSETDKSATPLKLMVGAIGVVFGDIGTSPLYAFKESFLGRTFVADQIHILNVLSLLFWSVMMVVTLKYVFLLMKADNKGEGGSLSLLALASRISHENNALKFILPLLGVFAAALFYGDSMITPAISVLSAVEGLSVISPDLSPLILPATLTILIFLFVVQRGGTGAVGQYFGPIMCLWFFTLAALGVSHIIDNPSVLRALNPYYAYQFFVVDKWVAYLTLGAVVLALTGAEALYADMGHFGKRPIRIAWLWIIFPALMLNYFGQGAYVMKNPEGVENPFFMMAPMWMEWPLLILAALAAIIASQAVITGAFSVTKQAIQLGYLPRIRVEHTSAGHMGQIYIPFVNWIIFVAVCLLVIGFKTSSNLAHAYGVAVTGTMLIDGILLSIVMFKLWKWKPVIAIPLAITIITIDLAYFFATCTKIPYGGWFPLVFGLFIFVMLTTWKTGRVIVARNTRRDMMNMDVFLNNICDNIPRVPGTAIFMTALEDGVPPSLLNNLRHNKILHERNILLHVVVEERPYVREEKKFEVHDLGHNFKRLTVRYGFKDELDIPAEMAKTHHHGLIINKDDTTYFLGKETIVPSPLPGMVKWREYLFAWISRNALSAVEYYNLPSKRVMEIGSRIDI
jgi:KUP system potassium uptake protein